MMRENWMAPYEDRYLPAGDWGDPDVVIPGWEVVEDISIDNIQEGDVAAYKQNNLLNATGHMGIIGYNEGSMRLIYAGTAASETIHIAATPMTYWIRTKKNLVIRRYVGTNK